jgi:hypothetical protein
MPDDMTTQNAAQEAQAAQDPGQDAAGPQEPPQGARAASSQEADHEQAAQQENADVASLRREAASRRRELREVQVERDALRAEVERMHRSEVERRAAGRLAAPGDLWLVTELDAMRDDAGALDGKRVDTEVTRVLREHPTWATAPVTDPAAEHAGARQPVEPRGPSFGAALKGRRS